MRASALASFSLLVRFDDFLRSLHELNQHPFPTQRLLGASLRMQETDIESRSAFANSAGGETHSLCGQMIHASLQIVNPCMQRGDTNRWHGV